MIDLIETHVMDLLQGSAALYAGGNAWANGWKGVKRVDEDTKPVKDFVNLFDTPYEKAPTEQRPAVYLGMKGLQASDKLYQQILSIPPGQYRCVTLPLVISCHAARRIVARRMANQLRENVKSIIWQHQAENGFWYRLDFPGDAGGGVVRDASSVTSSGDATQEVAEGTAIVSVQIYYWWAAGSAA